MDDILMETELNMQSAIENMEKRLLNIRAGRANPAILDSVMVNYYGALTPLKQLATISIPEARQLMIKPFDKGSLSAVEKGIYEANIGLTPNNNGEVIILNIPALTEDTRKEMKQVLTEIQDGTFASEFIQEFNAGGKAKFLATRKMEASHLLCSVGAELRKMMSWLKK